MPEPTLAEIAAGIVFKAAAALAPGDVIAAVDGQPFEVARTEVVAVTADGRRITIGSPYVPVLSEVPR